jgi:hypothetical protein
MNNVINAFSLYETDPSLLADWFSRSNGPRRRLGYAAGLVYGTWPLKFWRNWDEVHLLRFFKTYASLAETPYYEAKPAIGRTESDAGRSRWDYIRFPISKMSLIGPQFGRVRAQSADATTRLDMALVALALLEQQREHGQCPSRLEGLKSPDFDAVPVDPFTGQPFTYEPDVTGFTLRSPGSDGVVGNADDAQWVGRWWTPPGKTP